MATSLPPAADPKTLYILDVSGYVFRAYHAIRPLSNSKGEPTHAVHGVTQMLLKLVRDRQPALLAIAKDSPAPSFRKVLYDAYKANRPPTPPDLHQQMQRCYEIARAYEIPILGEEGVEADDIIAALVAKARDAGLRVVIVSADKDLLQLVGDDVLMWDSMRDRVFGEKETIEKMGVGPAQVRDYLSLVGDSSDNVPGVPKVGPKTAAELLKQYGSLDGIYEHLGEISKKAVKASLEGNRDKAYLSQRLVTLKADLDVDFDLDALRWTGGHPSRLAPLFRELEFTRLLAELEPEDGPAALEAGPTAFASTTTELVMSEASLLAMAAAVGKAERLAFEAAVDGDNALVGEWVGLAIAAGGRAWYLPLGHRFLGAPPNLDMEGVRRALGAIFSDGAIAKESSDVKGLETLLRRSGMSLAGVRFDTTIASYLLDAGRHAHELERLCGDELGLELGSYEQLRPKQRGARTPLFELSPEQVGEYAGRRAQVVAALRERLGARLEAEGFGALMRDVELPLAHVLSVMEGIGVGLDVPHLERMAVEVSKEVARLERRCHELAGREFNVGSPRQLETILFDELSLPVIKKTKTARSTDHEVLEELAVMHALPAAILEHRTLAKLKSTYIDALPRQVSRQTGRVHTVYNQAVAATGRLSSSDPNLQNIPIRTELGRRIRDAFVPQEGWEMMSADYSQIELRVLAHLSADPELVEAFSGVGDDVHARTAAAIFGVPAAEVSREQRGAAKTVNYAVIYGQSAFALSNNLRIPRPEAKRYIDAFFERYAGVQAYLDGVVEEARRTGGTRTILGRHRALPDLHSKNFRLRAAAERIARNTPIQGSAADIMKVAMVRIERALEQERFEARMLLTVHDELVFEAPPEEKTALEKMALRHMEHAIELAVPLAVEHGWGKTWGEAH